MNCRKSSIIPCQQTNPHNLRNKRRGEDMRSPEKKSAKRTVLNDININADAVSNTKNSITKTKKKSLATRENATKNRNDAGEYKENAGSRQGLFKNI